MQIAQNGTKSHIFARNREIFNKVPAVTLYFWIIKILSTIVGETASDTLNGYLGWMTTGFIIVGLLIITFFLQIALKKYVPGIYWLTVILMSIFGTFLADTLADGFKIPELTTIIIISIALVVTFVVWFACEKTLSVRVIFTIRQECFYWFAILLTFILGIASEDYVANVVDPGYLIPAIIIIAGIVGSAIVYKLFKPSAGLVFWVAFLLTHPLGAIPNNFIGDLLPDPGPLLINGGFLAIILIIVIYLTISKKDVLNLSSLSMAEIRNSAQKWQRVPHANFKQDVVQLDLMTGRPLTQLARDLSISDSSTHQWHKRVEEYRPNTFSVKLPQTVIEEENCRLKREIDVLRQELDVLKKAISIFSHQKT
jgi:uncharacterized membrane-anchored protein/transposase-like protein